jgi:hypothetical protein
MGVLARRMRRRANSLSRASFTAGYEFSPSRQRSTTKGRPAEFIPPMRTVASSTVLAPFGRLARDLTLYVSPPTIRHQGRAVRHHQA